MPDLGQSGVRDEIRTLREQVLSQARQTEQLRADAERLRQEYHRSTEFQRARQQQFDRWLAELGAAKVGQTVPINHPPGRGKLVELDLPAGKAKVETSRGPLELPVQELFPQAGPFARPHKGKGKEKGRRGRKGAKAGPPRPEKEKADRPVRHRSPDSKAARQARQAVLNVPPGEPVYVVPFHKRATLIRFETDKDQAIVQSGVFEMEIPIADLEPVKD
jgi:hypothetical protein